MHLNIRIIITKEIKSVKHGLCSMSNLSCPYIALLDDSAAQRISLYHLPQETSEQQRCEEQQFESLKHTLM